MSEEIEIYISRYREDEYIWEWEEEPGVWKSGYSHFNDVNDTLYNLAWLEWDYLVAWDGKGDIDYMYVDLADVEKYAPELLADLAME